MWPLARSSSTDFEAHKFQVPEVDRGEGRCGTALARQRSGDHARAAGTAREFDVRKLRGPSPGSAASSLSLAGRFTQSCTICSVPPSRVKAGNGTPRAPAAASRHPLRRRGRSCRSRRSSHDERPPLVGDRHRLEPAVRVLADRAARRWVGKSRGQA